MSDKLPMAKKSITLFDSMDNTGRYMLNVGAPGPEALREVTDIMKLATEIRLVSFYLFIYLCYIIIKNFFIIYLFYYYYIIDRGT